MPKKPRTEKGASGASERSMVVVLGERGKASLSDNGVIDLTAPVRLHPGRTDEGSVRPSTSAAAGPSNPGSSRPSGSTQVSAEVGS